MPKPFWQFTLSVGGALLCMAFCAADRAQAQAPGAPVIYSGDACDDDCAYDCGHREAMCRRIKMHCAYFGRKCSRPFVRVQGVPPELAPYIGPGTYHSPGYGLPYGAGYGTNSACYGLPQTAPQGYTR